MAMMKTPAGEYYIEAPTKDDILAEADRIGTLCEEHLRPLSHYAIPASFSDYVFTTGVTSATLRKNGNEKAADRLNAAIIQAFTTFLMEDAVPVGRFGADHPAANHEGTEKVQ